MEDKLKNMLRIFLDSIRDYEHESGKGIYNDERTSEEFVEIFIDSEDSFNYHELIKILSNEPKVVRNDENTKKKCIAPVFAQCPYKENGPMCNDCDCYK